ncbi:uncharacterized protein LOC141655703 [Silene latifolia]|uniref:uncharacterized protein LOC141655703 n=1 Tax=Silene latifolia TaxID=37657 RepID=UPI003D76DDE7
MTKWSVHLSGYDLQFEPRTAIKSQALADFVSDFCPATRGEAEEGMLTMMGSQDGEVWTLYIDGASNARGAGVGLVLRSPKGDMIVQAIRCEFKATNNEAEYEAIILGMQMASGLKARNLRVYSDSLLVVNHVNNEYVARDSKMIAYLNIATEQKSKFRTFKITQVPRDQNVEADALATLGATFQPTELSNIPITHVLIPAIQKEPDQDSTEKCVQETRILVSPVGQQDADWRVPYLNWLRDGTLPEDKKEAQSFRIKASRYIMIDNILFRKSLAGPSLRCLSKEEAETVLQDMHSGECGNHAGGRSLSNKILRQGYFWPTMRADAINHAKRCESCQKAAPAIHQPAEPMHPIISPWPFMMWGMDIVGKLPRAPGNRVYMLVMTDYFSKWIEAEAMTEVKEQQVISFIKRNIISRFGIPSEIICDNGSQFISDNTEGFCARWNIRLRKSAPRYPQTNGQAESSNKIIVENLRKRLEELGGKWADELPLVLWSDRTTPKMATGQTPFSLVYGAEAVIPSEVLVPTHRYGCQTADQNKVEMTRSLDTVDELRESAYIRMASYKQSVARTYNKNVKIRTLEVGDLDREGFSSLKSERVVLKPSSTGCGFLDPGVALEHHETAPGNLHYFGLYNASTKEGFGTNVGYLSDEAHLEGPAPAM